MHRDDKSVGIRADSGEHRLALRATTDAIGLILDQPPIVVDDDFRSGTILTQRWKHGALHDYLPGMNGHVVMTYYGAERDIAYRADSQRFHGKTRPGVITLIPDGYDGRWDISGPIEVSHVYLSADRLQVAADLLTGGRVPELVPRVGFEDPTAARILEMLSREASLAEPSSRLFVEQAIDLLCTQLVRGHSSLAPAADAAPRRGLADWQIKRVTEYMLERLEEDIGLNELAALVNLSRFHFCTAFRLAMGTTPYKWLLARRIDRARELLANLSLSVTEVALAVGYDTPSAFTASFRKVMGVTPMEFRRSL